MWRTEQPSELTNKQSRQKVLRGIIKQKPTTKTARKKETKQEHKRRQKNFMYTTIIKEMRESVKLNSVRLHNIRNKKIYYLPAAPPPQLN